MWGKRITSSVSRAYRASLLSPSRPPQIQRNMSSPTADPLLIRRILHRARWLSSQSEVGEGKISLEDLRSGSGTNTAAELDVKEKGKAVAESAKAGKKETGLVQDFDTIVMLTKAMYENSPITRIRSALYFATHTFFDEHNSCLITMPLITTSDCEGVSTTLPSEAEKWAKEAKQNRFDPLALMADIKAAELDVKEKGKAVAELKSAKAGKEEISGAVVMLAKAEDSLAKLKLRLEEGCRVRAGLPLKDGKIDFLARLAFLTVSRQLQLQALAELVGSVHAFGHAFASEQSSVLVESEIVFADIKNVMKCAEDYVKYMCQWLLDHCLDDMELVVNATAIDRLKMVASSDFIRLTYTDAIECLVKASQFKKFENKVEWGIELASEHERYLTDEVYKKPVIVYNYPKDIVAFYVKVNEDQKTAAAMDVLVPKFGKLVGGGQREDNHEVLVARMLEMGMSLEPYEWYLDFRCNWPVMYSGFALGFEKMVQFATGIDNIGDVIPFPRYLGKSRSLKVKQGHMIFE